MENRKLNEVWGRAPKGVKVKNLVFEFVKRKYVKEVVTEES